MQQQSPVYVDDRQGSKELDLLLTSCGLPTKVRRLRYGDFSFYSPNGPNNKPVGIGIERKKVLDFISSMETGRLAGSQLPGMAELYDFSFLIVEGDYVPNFETGRLMVLTKGDRFSSRIYRDQQRDYRLVDGILNTLRLKTGVHVIRTSTQQQTATEIYMLWHWFRSKRWDSHKSHMDFAQPPPPSFLGTSKPSFFRHIAKEVPGIGWDRSIEVESLYRGNVVNFINSTVEEFSRINGITRKRAQDIWRKLRNIKLENQE